MRRWGLALPVGRLVGAGMLGALTEAAGICLMATATWLLVTAAGQPSITALTVAIVTVRALAIGRGVLRYLERLAGHDAVLRIVTEVRARIFATLVDRPPIRHADALSRMVSDVDAVQDLVVRVALPIASAGLVALLAVIVTFTFASGAGGVLLAGLLVTAVAIPVLGARLVRRGASRLAPLRAAYAVSTVDLVHGAADLAAYGATQRYEARGAAQAAELSTVERHLARRAFALDALSSTVTGLTAAAVLYTAAQDGLSPVWAAVLAVGTLATGELALGLLAATRKGAEILSPLARVNELLTPTGPARPRPLVGAGTETPTPTGHAGQVSHEPSTPIGYADSGPHDNAGNETPTPTGVGGELAGIRVVGASVEGRLREVDLTIAPGRRIAVVGASGAGKSTLLYVIAGEIKPDSGAVSGNGTPYSVATGLMADAHIFHASIRDNLLLAKPDATDDQLHAALRVAGLGDFSAYPLEVIVGEDGAELSGGQRQRLALARAVLAAPRVLLLDEPTEGLDPDQADRVLESVLADAGDRAVVLVTHRLAHVDRQHFDEVLVMTEGSVRSSDPTH